jgi:tetratricopeptide (TPR) repeat protein
VTENSVERQDYAQQFKTIKNDMVKAKPLTVVPGRTGTSQLPVKKSGVPYFSTTKKEVKKLKDGKEKILKITIKDIPRLDIGTESSVSKNDFIPKELQVPKHKLNLMTALKTPEFVSDKEMNSWTKAKREKVLAWKEPKDGDFGLGKIVTAKKVEKVDVNMVPEKVMAELKAVTAFTKDDINMLNALLMLKDGNKCHVASGLLHDLSSDNKYKEEANYLLGVCAHQMGFHSEAVARLLRVIRSEHPEFTSDAILSVLEDLPREYAVDVAKAIQNLKQQDLVPAGAKDMMYFVFSQAAHQKNNYAEAYRNADKVSEKSPLYAKSKYLSAIGLYGDRQHSKAQKSLEDLRAWMTSKKQTDKSLEALIIVNLARIYFMQEKYELAYKEYLKTPKDHPLWVQALTEQGWAQLSIGDPEGAIGNMYSLHSPYFKSVFMPNSWVVRTVGYIDICQYGDAYRTLTKLEAMHSGHLESVKKYRAAHKSGSDYYSTVKTYLRGKSDQVVDGLPSQVIREIARRREFLNVQDALNTREDEITQLAFIQSLIVKDIHSLKSRLSKAKERMELHKANLNKIKKQPELAKNEFDWKSGLRAEQATIRKLNFELGVHNESKKGFSRLTAVATSRINKDKDGLKVDAGKALVGHLKEVEGDLGRILESNEFLRYEVFAGSGENIRYQVAGGSTSAARKVPANIRPAKLQNWDFDGEYWEDEIGSYRSSLRNNCPNHRRNTAGIEKGE